MMILVGYFTVFAGAYLGHIVADASFAPTWERVLCGLLAICIVFQGGCMVAAGRKKQ